MLFAFPDWSCTDVERHLVAGVRRESTRWKVTCDALEFLVREVFDPQFGARPFSKTWIGNKRTRWFTNFFVRPARTSRRPY
ncbi:hypothetical protein [Oleiharenicola lentus]|uniref:hypothetical protein n=1 Tax=Oleiharenicola lentus TaxID=2508720 RepID=UPI003F67247A